MTLIKSTLRQFLFGTSLADNKVLNIGWLLFRLHVGLSIAIHAGWPKMYTITAPGWFTDQVAGLGFTFPSSGFWAAMAAWGEFAGGILIAAGLLTRFAALQLAFQFFVIAFLWYDNPEPLTGMYFQHLYFWCYVLITVAGAGRYSLDKWIMKSKRTTILPAAKTAMACLFLLITVHAGAQTGLVSRNDFKPVLGQWKGSITYLDYSSGKPFTMPANVTISRDNTNEQQLILAFTYPDEPKANGKDTLVISKDGLAIDGAMIMSKEKAMGKSVKIITQKEAVDGNDNRKATIRHIYTISKKNFSSRKEVRFDGDKTFILRNEYSMHR